MGGNTTIGHGPPLEEKLRSNEVKDDRAAKPWYTVLGGFVLSSQLLGISEVHITEALDDIPKRLQALHLVYRSSQSNP